MYIHILIYVKKAVNDSKSISHVTHYKSYGLGLTYINEVHKHIVYILGDIIFISQQWFYDILCVMLSLQIFWNFPYCGKLKYPGFLQGFLYGLIIGLLCH